MGEARFNGMHSRPATQGLNAQGLPQHHNAVGPYGEITFHGGIELDEILSLQHSRILLAPEHHTHPNVNVAALIQQAVNQDPHGHSLHADTLTKLKHAPANPHDFGV